MLIVDKLLIFFLSMGVVLFGARADFGEYLSATLTIALIATVIFGAKYRVSYKVSSSTAQELRLALKDSKEREKELKDELIEVRKQLVDIITTQQGEGNATSSAE